MTFARRGNRLRTRFSERISVVKRRTTEPTWNQILTMDRHVGFSATSLQIHQLNWRLLYITYLYHTFLLHVSMYLTPSSGRTYKFLTPKTPVFTQRLSKVQWLRRPKCAVFPTWVTQLHNGITSQWVKELRSSTVHSPKNALLLISKNTLKFTLKYT